MDRQSKRRIQALNNHLVADSAAVRDWTGPLTYYQKNAPTQTVKDTWGEWEGVIPVGGKSNHFTDPEIRKRVFESREMTVVDARTHLSGGLKAWDFEEHGFVYVNRPEYPFPEHLEQDRKKVDSEFGPKVLEEIKRVTGAKQAFWCSHQRRSENGDFAARYAVGACHTDYGPDFEDQFRTVLHHRFGMPEDEANSCGLVVANMWAPVERPAYIFPLAYLDGSTVDMETDTIKYKLDQSFDNGYNYQIEADGTGRKHGRPLEERVPAAAKDAPALSPVYNPKHRWVYCSDMKETEAVLFKQYDFRPEAKTRATFHCAIPDNYHKKQGFKAPGRRSIECRLILTF